MNAMCCRDLDILPIDLLLPDHMNDEGREFVEAHGLYNIRLEDLVVTDAGNGLVKIKHKCQYLDDQDKCLIYDNRPQICRNFDCALRHDCDCKKVTNVSA